MVRIVDRSDYVLVEDVPVDASVFKYLANWLDRVQTRYEDEVVKKAVGIVTKSLRELNIHRLEDFVSYGDYRIFDGLTAQLKQEFNDPYFEPRPYLVTLYGPPGTGKTTWVRNVAKKYLVEDGLVKGIYLEVTSGDLQCKWAGVPINTAKSIMECIRTRDHMSILLMDEADSILLRPEKVSGGVTLEQMQLVSEMKSQLTFITSQNVPTLIALTTNYKDIIARAEPALADRVVAWIEVPPPPQEVKEKIVGRVLARVFRNMWFRGNPLGQVTILRTLMWGGIAPLIRNTDNLRFRWRLPILPFDADYLIGYLTAWGWNPLDEKTLPALELDINRAVYLWRYELPYGENPLLKVYARGLITEIELARYFIEEQHGMPKSFLRAYSTLKRGIEDVERLFTQVYVEGYDIVLEALEASENGEWGKVKRLLNKLRELGLQVEGDAREALKTALNRYARDLKATLFTHPVPPIVMHQLLAKYMFSRDFMQIVNDIHSVIAPITGGIRYVFIPMMAVPTDSLFDATAILRWKLYYYNKLVKQELLKGRILEPLRIMYTVENTEEAWREAVKSLNQLEGDIRRGIALALLPLKLLHPAIHAKTTEEKAGHLYKTFRDRDRVEKMLWNTAKELDIQEDICIILDRFLVPGLYVWPDRAYVTELTIFQPRIFDYYKNNIYHPASHINDLGAITVGVEMLSRNLIEKIGKAIN